MNIIIFVLLLLVLLFILSILVTRFIKSNKIKKKSCECNNSQQSIDKLSRKSGYPIHTKSVSPHSIQHLNLYSFPDAPLKNDPSVHLILQEYQVSQEESVLQDKINQFQDTIQNYKVDDEKDTPILFDDKNVEITQSYTNDVLSLDLKNKINWLIFECLSVINRKLNRCFGNIEINHIIIHKDTMHNFRIENDIFLYELERNYRLRIKLTIILHKMEIWLQHIELYNKQTSNITIHTIDINDSIDIESDKRYVQFDTVPKSRCSVIKNTDNYNRWIIPNIPDTIVSPTCCNQITQWDSFGININPTDSRRCIQSKINEIVSKWPDYRTRNSKIYEYLFKLTRGNIGIPTGISNK